MKTDVDLTLPIHKENIADIQSYLLITIPCCLF